MLNLIPDLNKLSRMLLVTKLHLQIFLKAMNIDKRPSHERSDLMEEIPPSDILVDTGEDDDDPIAQFDDI